MSNAVPDWAKLNTSVNSSIDQDTLRRALFSRVEAANAAGEKLVEEYRTKIAETLLLSGITLIPSEHLLDHQYVVSRGVYDAAKKLAEKHK